MIAASGAKLHLSCPVSALSEDRSGVRIEAADGRTFSARRAILATGINPLSGINFTPSLPAEKSAAVRLGHLGRAVKVWAKVENVPVGILATGGGRGIEWMFSERALADRTTLLVGFGVAANSWTPAMPQDAAEAVARFFPEANMLATDWHDWNTDDYSRGAWVAGVVGQPEAHDARTWTACGNLAFATSDVAAREAGWFEAAIISGEDAAREIALSLAPASANADE
jgi:monoamine oxidase